MNMNPIDELMQQLNSREPSERCELPFGKHQEVRDVIMRAEADFNTRRDRIAAMMNDTETGFIIFNEDREPVAVVDPNISPEGHQMVRMGLHIAYEIMGEFMIKYGHVEKGGNDGK